MVSDPHPQSPRRNKNKHGFNLSMTPNGNKAAASVRMQKQSMTSRKSVINQMRTTPIDSFTPPIVYP